MLLTVSFLSAVAGVTFAGTAALLPDTGINGTLEALLAFAGAVTKFADAATLTPGSVSGLERAWVGDTILIGWAAKDWAYTVEPPGNLIAVDARTGDLLWDTGFSPLELIPVTGTAKIWSSMSADPELGLVHVPVSLPSPNYWGGNRTDPIPLASSISAIGIETGEVTSSFQHVHHDVWDYDTPSAPTLADQVVAYRLGTP